MREFHGGNVRADTWEGELNGPVSPSTVRENIEVRFLFYSVAGGWGYGQEDKEEAVLEHRGRHTLCPGFVECPEVSHYAPAVNMAS